MKLDRKLRLAREQADMTQQRAAELAGLERNSVWRYEAGQREPSASTLRILARIYNKPVDWFWEEEEEKQESEFPPLTPEQIEANRELVMSVPNLAMRTTTASLSDEALADIADYIRFVRERDERRRRERQAGG